uniref:Putative secreted protein n=1 Tax=Anopheles triannulatus TaxID=58253 RepID=A0A2M4B3T1_9DIPT
MTFFGLGSRLLLAIVTVVIDFLRRAVCDCALLGALLVGDGAAAGDSSWLLWWLLLEESLSLSDEEPDDEDDEDELEDSEAERAGPLSRKGNTSCFVV